MQHSEMNRTGSLKHLKQSTIMGKIFNTNSTLDAKQGKVQ